MTEEQAKTSAIRDPFKTPVVTIVPNPFEPSSRTIMHVLAGKTVAELVAEAFPKEERGVELVASVNGVTVDGPRTSTLRFSHPLIIESSPPRTTGQSPGDWPRSPDARRLPAALQPGCQHLVAGPDDLPRLAEDQPQRARHHDSVVASRVLRAGPSASSGQTVAGADRQPWILLFCPSPGRPTGRREGGTAPAPTYVSRQPAGLAVESDPISSSSRCR